MTPTQQSQLVLHRAGTVTTQARETDDARRPQVQERLTEQIIGLLEDRLAPAGAMVVLRARHLCMEMRGVGRPGLTTTTSAIRGAFEDGRLRQEFLAMLPATPQAGGV